MSLEQRPVRGHPGVERADAQVVLEPKRTVGLACAEAQHRRVRARERERGG